MSRKFLSALLSGIFFVLALPFGAAATPPPAELISSGRVDDAIWMLRQHLQSAPNDAAAYAMLMRAYYAVQQWDEAINSGQKATTLAPDNSQYHLWLGRAYGEKADHSSWVNAISLAKKARAEFEKAVALNGSSIDARSDLAEFYVEAPSFLGGGKDKAQVQAQEIQRLGDQPTAHYIRAIAAESDKNYGLAEQELRAAVQASNGNPDFMLNLASFYRRRGRMGDLEKVVNDAVSSAAKSRHNHVLFDAAELLYRAGRNFSGAMDLLRGYISSPQHSEEAPVFQAHYLMGNILERMGDKSAAAAQYRQALNLASNFEPAISALKKVGQ